MHTENVMPRIEQVIRRHLLRVTLIAYTVLTAVLITVWMLIMRYVWHIASGNMALATCTIIALGLAAAALAFYWSFDE